MLESFARESPHSASFTARRGSMTTGLDRRTLEPQFNRTYGRRQSVSRGWVIWHLIEHKLHHGTEIVLILRSNGLPTLEV